MRNEAAELPRALADKIALSPKESRKELPIDLYVDLARILTVVIQKSAGKQDSLAGKLQALVSNDNDPDLQIKW